MLAVLFVGNDRFLDGQFRDLGWRWLNAVHDPSVDSKQLLYRTFPRITRCEFQSYGPAGGINEKSFMCVLAPNIISEKIFVFLWFWYAVLGVVGAVNLALLVLMACRSGTIRNMFIMRALLSKKVNEVFLPF